MLKAACGATKLCKTLAQVGYDVAGIDRDATILAFARARAERLPNLHIRQTELLLSPWGREFDAVIPGANLMVSIVTDREYMRAEKSAGACP